jgi:hypothetical protein
MMIEQREYYHGVHGAAGTGTGEIAEELQPRRVHFEVLLTGDSYPLSRVVTELVESTMRKYPAGCEITITSRV